MALVERVPLDDDPDGASWLEIHDDGRQIWKTSDGKIVRSHLPSELASELARIPKGDRGERERTIDALLKSRGADVNNTELRLLASMVADGKYFSIPALSLLRKLTGADDDSGSGFKLVNENMIEYNGRVFIHTSLTKAGAMKLLRACDLANQGAAAEAKTGKS